jgi:hypothetical protein
MVGFPETKLDAPSFGLIIHVYGDSLSISPSSSPK